LETELDDTEEASMTVRAIPDGYYSLTPYIIVKGAREAMAYYTKAFGAQELFIMPGPDGSVMHAEMQIGNARLMLGEENLERGAKSPKTLGGSAGSVMIYTEDVDATFKRATDAGGTVAMPVQDMFWGDRYGAVLDPFGHQWQIATHKEDLTPEEMDARMKATATS
jgi:PhnB protein